MHVAGSRNTAADFLSRPELTPKDKIQLELRDDILKSPVEINLKSTDVADEEQLFVLPEEEEEEPEKEIFARKSLSKQRAIEAKKHERSTKVSNFVKNTS